MLVLRPVSLACILQSLSRQLKMPFAEPHVDMQVRTGKTLACLPRLLDQDSSLEDYLDYNWCRKVQVKEIPEGRAAVWTGMMSRLSGPAVGTSISRDSGHASPLSACSCGVSCGSRSAISLSPAFTRAR